jgi:hypothetical protein
MAAMRENPERPLRIGDSGVLVAEVVATDPASVVCEESIFVNAVTTLGVPLMSYAEYRADDPVKAGWTRRLVWKLGDKSIDGSYTYKQLREWWMDEGWMARHPGHELAVLWAGSMNLLRMAARIREQPHLVWYARETGDGRIVVAVPEGATSEERERLLGLFKN